LSATDAARTLRREIAMAGAEWIVDAAGCDPARLASVAACDALLASLARELELHVVRRTVHGFPPAPGGGPGGVTAMWLLAESHLTIHTFPESGLAALNLYVCRPRARPSWERLLRERLGATRVEVRQLARGGAA
jgi:S-adenosylmethionine decarboxylase